MREMDDDLVGDLGLENQLNDPTNRSRFVVAGAISNNANRKLINRVRKFFVGKLFKINHVLLDNQAITVLFFHIILLLEFLQLQFYVFNKATIINEF